jgi:hypothetical protein
VFIAVFGIFAIFVKRARPPLRNYFRPFRLRLRLWQFMAAILMVGALLEAAILARRTYDAYQKAEYHSFNASVYRSFRDPRSFVNFCDELAGPGPHYPVLLSHFRRLEGYHEQMRQKYRDIARHPWRTVSADPPEPESKMLEDLHELISSPQGGR